MKVILIQNVASLGKVGDTVKVSDGYGRNYLIPKGLAMEATTKNVKVLDHNKKAILQRNAKEQKKADLLKGQLEGLTCTIERRVGEQGKLFGSVNTKDIEEALKKQGVDIDRKNIVLDEVIKTLGEFPVKVKLPAGSTADLKIDVVAAAE